MKLAKQYFKITDILMPSVAAKQVYHVMSNPRHRKLKAFEEEALNSSSQYTIEFNSFTIQVYTWGKKTGKTAFLIHGWEGHAGNFGALVNILIQKGYHIIAFDAPSHGNSSKGNTNMFEFADLVSLMLQKHEPDVIISHSFGSVTTAFALHNNPEINIKNWILVTTPHNFKDRIQDIVDYVGASQRTTNRLINVIEKNSGFQVDQLNMDVFGGQLNNVEKAVIAHSKTDKIIPIESSRKTHEAMPQSDFIELDGMGHYAILWSDELKKIIEERL